MPDRESIDGVLARESSCHLSIPISNGVLTEYGGQVSNMPFLQTARLEPCPTENWTTAGRWRFDG